MLTDRGDCLGYETDWTGRFHGRSVCVVRPADTYETAGVVKVCNSVGVAVVAQGGNTGLVGGATPRGGEVVVSTGRIAYVECVDDTPLELVVGAGTTLGAVQAVARDMGAEFGVDMASRGSATIGGMIATNAGGAHVLRDGMMRDQVLGLEAVFSDGTIAGKWPGLRKDNTGIDIAHLLVGSEGTLAIVTRAHLRLIPALRFRTVAIAGYRSTDDAMAAARSALRDVHAISAIELMTRRAMQVVTDHTSLPNPLRSDHDAYVLFELRSDTPQTEALGALLADVDSAVADTHDRCERLWTYRDQITESIAAIGVAVKLDVSVPIAKIAAFIDRLNGALDPSFDTIVFGHAGDANLHVNVLGADRCVEPVEDTVFSLVASFGGSISAEHGIGIAKARHLELTRSASDVAVMKSIKSALDPNRIMNPGVIFGARPSS